MYEGQWITQVHRCGTGSVRKVPVNLASVARCLVRAVWLWFERQTRCNQAVCVCILARLCVPKSWHVHLRTAPGGSIALQVNKLSLKLHRLAIFPPQQHGPCWEHSLEYMKFLPPCSAGRGRNNPPVMSQPISPSFAECYVSWWYL